MNRAQDLFKKLTENGEAAIDELIETRKSEELFLDFKRSADNGAGSRLHDRDRQNFGKAISGFGNSEGGVIVWGIDCSKSADGADVASTKFSLADAPAFASRLEGAVSGSTIPPHSGVRSVPVCRPLSQSGFVVTLIPKSNSAPHQSVLELKYHMRAGSDFVPVPHGILAGMFGRRPQPTVAPNWLVFDPMFTGEFLSFGIGINIKNFGSVIARDAFITLHSLRALDGKLGLNLQPADDPGWSYIPFAGQFFSIMTPSGFRLAPGGVVFAGKLQFRCKCPFVSDLLVEGTVGCEGSPPRQFSIQATKEEFNAVCEKQILGGTTPDSLKVWKQFMGQILRFNSED